MFTVLAALSGMEREYTRDRTLEGHESARKRSKAIGRASSPTTPCPAWPSTCATRN
jgi:DNA invertase Pin-like site-specific DNA recombinase